MQSIARNIRRFSVAHGRHFATTRALPRDAIKTGLVVGMFASHKLFSSEQMPQALQDKIIQEVQALDNKADAGSVQLVLSPDLTQHIAVVGLGSSESTANTTEIVRTAVANGIKQLKAKKVSDISIAPMPSAHAAGEAAALASFTFTAFKTQKKAEESPLTIASADATAEWSAGRVYAEAQNYARELMATPANYMTPTIFAQRVRDEMASLANVTVNVHDEQWARRQRMGGLIAVAQGSDEPLRFVEIIYRGRPGDPVALALVGKGITFDTGGYSLKLGKNMDLMKGDMGGGATVVAAMRAIAQLQLPINVVATVPLCENMVSGRATKVSDVYTSRAGLTVEVMNTDAEGRIVLADALHYTVEAHQPQSIVDVATLTGAMVVALGELYTGVFTPSPTLWQHIDRAGATTDEPVWRMPLHDRWDAMLKSPIADLSNIGCKGEAGACTAAAFLRQFVDGPRLTPPAVMREQNNDESVPRWAHLDIAGPMEASTSEGYHHQGMSGRPTRLLIELAKQLSAE
ncbi:hypothetical protein IWW39_002800 [Coemansia spiralis]|uniref:Cytosol aminopeptidase domain-containing protein n=1 Tax=Coemansia spiralis TaxID=417178 RepID=A0A9W8GMP2_9FUNG|nr:hypothetical protein IWW39_002800 [Coemansia spiralis]